MSISKKKLSSLLVNLSLLFGFSPFFYKCQLTLSGHISIASKPLPTTFILVPVFLVFLDLFSTDSLIKAQSL